MTTEARTIADILRRLDHLEALTQITHDFDVYTPIYAGLTTPGTPTYSLQEGWYQRDGALVYAWGRITWTAAGGAAGIASISLPSTVGTAASGTYRLSGGLWTNNVTIGTFTPQVLITQATAYFTMNTPANNAAGAAIAVEAAGDAIFAVFYPVEAI